jgi:hypothetical protein
MEQVSGRITWLELNRMTDWKRDGRVPVAVKATVETDDGRRAYVNTTCGYVQDVSGVELFMPTPGGGWKWAIPTGTDPRNSFVPTIWKHSRVALRGSVKSTGTCQDGKPWVSLNRVAVDDVVLEPETTPAAETPRLNPLGVCPETVREREAQGDYLPSTPPAPKRAYWANREDARREHERAEFDWSAIMAAVNGGKA